MVRELFCAGAGSEAAGERRAAGFAELETRKPRLTAWEIRDTILKLYWGTYGV